jgi:lipopolysaccharide export system protein LptC
VSRNTVLINFVFFFVIAISIIGLKQVVEKNSYTHKEDNRHTPDYYMINAAYLRTNDAGHEEIQMVSPTIKHYAHQNTSVFLKPIIKLYKNGQQWSITSQKAKGINGTNTFIFSNDVIAKQLATSKNPETQLSTQSLTVLPKKELVLSDELVTIAQPGLTITGKGLRGDLNSGNIQLLSKTRGQYDPRIAR